MQREDKHKKENTPNIFLGGIIWGLRRFATFGRFASPLRYGFAVAHTFALRARYCRPAPLRVASAAALRIASPYAFHVLKIK